MSWGEKRLGMGAGEAFCMGLEVSVQKNIILTINEMRKSLKKYFVSSENVRTFALAFERESVRKEPNNAAFV